MRRIKQIAYLHMQDKPRPEARQRTRAMSTSNAAVEVGVVPKEIATGVAGVDFLEGLRKGTHPAPPFAVETDIWIVEVEDRAGRHFIDNVVD